MSTWIPNTDAGRTSRMKRHAVAIRVDARADGEVDDGQRRAGSVRTSQLSDLLSEIDDGRAEYRDRRLLGAMGDYLSEASSGRGSESEEIKSKKKKKKRSRKKSGTSGGSAVPGG